MRTLSWQALSDSAKAYPLPPAWVAVLLLDGSIAFYHDDPYMPVVYATPDAREEGFIDIQITGRESDRSRGVFGDVRESAGRVPFGITGREEDDADRFNQIMRLLLPELRRKYLVPLADA